MTDGTEMPNTMSKIARSWNKCVALPLSTLHSFIITSVECRSDSFSNRTRLAPLSTMMWPICRSLSQIRKNAWNNPKGKILIVSQPAAVQYVLNNVLHASMWTFHCAFCCFNNNQLPPLVGWHFGLKHSPRSLLSRNSAARRSTWMLQTFPSISIFV